VTGTPPPTDDDVRAHVIDVATALHQRLAAITIDMRTELAARITELSEDERLIDLLGASIEGNVDNILHSLRYGIPVDRIEPPSAGFEYARRLAQRGVPVNALVRAYRLGQQHLLRAAYEESRSRTVDVAVQHLAYDRIVTNTFDYIDMMSQQVVVVYEQERERWLADRNTLRIARVEELLAGGAVDDVTATEVAIGHRLRGRHLAGVIWVDETGAHRDQISRFTRTTNRIADQLALGAPLVIPRDRASAWVWLTVPDDFVIDAAAIGATLITDDPPQAMLALGRILPGPSGFRQSHEDALDAQRVCVVGDLRRPVVSYDETGVGIASLLARSPTATRRWVSATLGELATQDEHHQRLRDTLRLFLHHEGSYTATADTMVMHKNSVKYRVSSAEKAVGKPIRTNRLAIECALTACHWLGSTVLKQAQSG
jgi:PucR C-terminal helix-turn-helix domain/GGDEF-like domain